MESIISQNSGKIVDIPRLLQVVVLLITLSVVVVGFYDAL